MVEVLDHLIVIIGHPSSITVAFAYLAEVSVQDDQEFIEFVAVLQVFEYWQQVEIKL